jgi:hypothetical protein
MSFLTQRREQVTTGWIRAESSWVTVNAHIRAMLQLARLVIQIINRDPILSG